MEAKSSEETNQTSETKTFVHANRYLIIGIILSIFNYAFYTILANVIIKNNDLLWLSTLISTVATTILAYLLHSKITWKERDPGKTGIIKFFIWNFITAIIINPSLTQLFSLITPLYEIAFNISNSINLPFSYDFIQSTGAFILTAIITMILNFLFYDKFVFSNNRRS